MLAAAVCWKAILLLLLYGAHLVQFIHSRGGNTPFSTFTIWPLALVFNLSQLTGTSLRHHVGRQKTSCLDFKRSGLCEEIGAFEHTERSRKQFEPGVKVYTAGCFSAASKSRFADGNYSFPLEECLQKHVLENKHASRMCCMS